MKTGLTIKEMAQELLRQSKAKQDYLVNTGSLSLSVTSDVPQLRVTENGLDKITPLDIRQTAHRQLGTYLGIPQKYYELMRTDAPELLAYNANYWFSQKNELRTLRTMDGCARAFLSNRYRRIDNLDIASVSEAGAMPPKRQAGAGRNSSGQAEIQLCLQGIQPENGKAPDGRDACAGADLSGGAER